MDPRLTPLILSGALLAVLLAIIVYSVGLQRKAVGTQDSTVSKVDESLALSRESVQLQKENLALLHELIALHKETNRLLGLLVKERSGQ